MSYFLGTTGGLWLKGELEMKAAGVFISTGTIHGGQETTVLTSLVPLLHLGMVIVGTRVRRKPADPHHRRHRRLALRPRHDGRRRTTRGSRRNAS